MTKTTLWFLMLGLLGVGALLLRLDEEAAPDATPRYVDSDRCVGCHPDESARWKDSPHDLAMAPPTPDVVRGAFDGRRFEDTRFVRKGSDYFLEVENSTAGVSLHRVRYTFGVDPLQQYLLEFPGGRLQASAVAWDTEKERWFRVQSPELHYTSRYQTWNTMCADCHSTNVDKAYDPTTDRFETTFSEVDVGCQSCHGPGGDHVEDPSAPMTNRSDTEACAACHSRRAPLTPVADLTEPFSDHYRPMTLGAGLYFADGQLQDEVFEYGSFAQSAMFERGVRCVDCHDPHGATSVSDNVTCTQCHGAVPPLDRFPTLASRARDLDRKEHHHHEPGSAGAQCIACHMPARTYMGVDVRHDHRLAIPRPDVSAALETPDVCTSACHADRDSGWSTKVVESWFPDSDNRTPHFGPLLADARRGEANPKELRALAVGDAPAVVRATALEYLLGHSAMCLSVVVREDESPLVRSVGVQCAEALPPDKRASRVAWALRDSSRLVRLEAARVLAGAPVDDRDRQLYDQARQALDALYQSQRDRPEGAFNLALLAEAEGRTEDAARFYEEALSIDYLFRPARANLFALRRRQALSAR